MVNVSVPPGEIDFSKQALLLTVSLWQLAAAAEIASRMQAECERIVKYNMEFNPAYTHVDRGAFDMYMSAWEKKPNGNGTANGAIMYRDEGVYDCVFSKLLSIVRDMTSAGE